MPITINDCECGLKPNVKAGCGCGYQSQLRYIIECPRTDCKRQVDFDFQVAVHDWNTHNSVEETNANNDK